MTEKVLFLYDNKVDGGTVSAASTAGALAAANLQDLRLGKVARTTGISGQYWAVDFTATTPVDTVALVAHNLSVNAKVRVRLSVNADLSAPVYDATDYAWPAMYGWADLGWADDGYGGVADLTEFADYKALSIFRMGSRHEGRYLRLDIDDDGNAAGYFQAGRLIAGMGWQPIRNFSNGWSLAWQDDSESTEMEGGAVWFDRREKRRLVTLPFDYATEADAQAKFGDMSRIVGHSRDLLVLPFPAPGPQRFRTGIYGAPVKGGLSPVKGTGLNKYGFSVKVKELG